MAKQYELTIYIPTFNRVEKLRNCLCAVAQEIQGLEERVLVYVSNNGSEDETSSFLHSLDFPWVRIHENKKNLGGFLNVIRGFDLPVASEFVWIIGDDDYLLPNAISELLQLISQYPQADYVFCNTTAYDARRSEEILQKYFATRTLEPGAVKSKHYTGTALVNFEQLIDPKVADTLLGEMMVGCFRKAKFHFPYDRAEELNIDFTDEKIWDSIDFEECAARFQPHNLALLGGLTPQTLAVYCDRPRTFNFWGSAEWLGNYDFVFPVIILYLILQYRGKGLISEEKYRLLLDYYLALMKSPILRQLSGASTARPFNEKMKARLFDALGPVLMQKA